VFRHAAETASEERCRPLEDSSVGDLEPRREVEALSPGPRSADCRLREAIRRAADSFGFSLVGQTVSHYRVLEGK
jgi:hypothetical protein